MHLYDDIGDALSSLQGSISYSSFHLTILFLRYMNVVSGLKSIAWEALHDADTAKNCSSKRILKSFNNSLSHIRSCLSEAKSNKVPTWLLI